ncbi:C-type lectin domain family 1 member A-like [Dendropsophus ebraccatus]|uniref:C-type lectin domain family 1 member A-like n=1 Tax=Dendropsophus ebraccatus TaxID=150705 RepID=UPI0038322A4C
MLMTQGFVEKEKNYESNIYGNVDELFTEMDDTSTTKEESPSKITKTQITGAALVILIILFLILSVITGLLFKYYLAMSEEMSHLNRNHDLAKNEEMSRLKNHVDQQKMILEEVKIIKKELDDVKQQFLQDIKSINKTFESICPPCPDGWHRIGSSCYYVSKEETSWDEARDKCNQMNSVLVLAKTESPSQLRNPN